MPREIISLRKEMKKIIDDYGYNVLVERHSQIFKCRCVNEGKEKLFNSSKKCPMCNGSGKVIKLEKQKSSRHEYELDFSETTQLGKVSAPKFEFYFYSDVQVDIGDKIYEVGWKRGKPNTLYSIHEVIHIEEPRGFKGRIEYIMATTVKKDININEVERSFLGNISKYKKNFLIGG